MRKLYPALYVALSCAILYCVSCDLFYTEKIVPPPLPPAHILGR